MERENVIGTTRLRTDQDVWAISSEISWKRFEGLWKS